MMDAALLITRLVLAGVFTLAGVAKLSDLKGSRQSIIDCGVPSAIAAPLGLVLPLAELAIAATLLSASTAWWGALGGRTPLPVFVVGISMNLARGRKPECHCFFFFSSRRRHTRWPREWSSDVCSSDLAPSPRPRAPARPARMAATAGGRWCRRGPG